MTDPIEEMKKAGWILQEIDDNVFSWSRDKTDIVIFARPKPKPNAIVDWVRLIREVQDLMRDRQTLANLNSFDVFEIISKAIKKVE